MNNMLATSALVGLLLVSFALLLRLGVFVGRRPGGVDTWYYLAYADALDRRWSLHVHLPQYLLQDSRQSYPPLFPMFLSLIPVLWRRRWYWLVSPLLDCVHLLLLYGLTLRITADISVAALAGLTYASTPHLVSETRSLNGRSFGALLHSVALVLALYYVVVGKGIAALGLALAAGAAVHLASATAACGHALACVALALAFQDARFVGVAGGSFVAAMVVSRGCYLSVVKNYLHAVAYYRRNRDYFGAHAIRNSPVHGSAPMPGGPAQAGFLGLGLARQILRLVGENPFLMALPFAGRGVPPWGTALLVWALSLNALAVLVTLLPPLRALGPGRSFLKIGVFPLAYALAVSVGTARNPARPIVLAVVGSLALSLVAIGFFYYWIRRRAPVQTALVPPGLESATRHLAGLPGNGVLCLPTMYSDYTCYHSGKSVLWGGHCGDLRQFEQIAPVFRMRVPELLKRYGTRYLVLDTSYCALHDVGLDDQVISRGQWEGFELLEVLGEGSESARERQPVARAPEAPRLPGTAGTMARIKSVACQ